MSFSRFLSFNRRRGRTSDARAPEDGIQARGSTDFSASAPPTLHTPPHPQEKRPGFSVLQAPQATSHLSEASDVSTLVSLSPVQQKSNSTPSTPSHEDGSKAVLVLSRVLPSLPETLPAITLPEPIATSPSPVSAPDTVSSAPDSNPPSADELNSTLAETWDLVKEPPPQGSKSLLDRVKVPTVIDETISTVKQYYEPLEPVIKAAADAIEQTDIAKHVAEGIDTFFEGMPVLMEALDKVAELHPFIGVAVMAFKTVYTLELKRRDNEKKIVALYAEMRSMMEVLLQLKDVRDEKLVGPDKQPIEDRIKGLLDQTAKDIKSCSNACDTYAKKKLIAKVFQGPVWDKKLLSFVALFTKRRDEFQFAVTIHMTQSMDVVAVQVNMVDITTKEVNAKIDIMMEMFQKMSSPEYKALADKVEHQGRENILDDEDALQELSDEALHASAAGGVHSQREDLDELQEELRMDPEVEIKKNMVVFSRKFEVQKRQIVDELTLIVERESDRVIEAILAGPHDRILDQSIHEIWKEMGWRGNVKARHFVLALRDYYVEKQVATARKSVRGVTVIDDSLDPNAWALEYLTVRRIQPILEAFDDDASGFININEMNRFTSSRPQDWRLIHWIAYWAVGWRATVIEYAREIETLFAKMEGIGPELKAANRQSYVDYFRTVWTAVHPLTAALVDLEEGPDLRHKFESYIDAEETRLRTNLEAVDYVIDGEDTLQLVTGTGRIEKFIFPVLYLLIKRHFEILRVARKKVISSHELFDSAESILFAADAMTFRLKDLRNIFTQQRLDIAKQLKVFAYGMRRCRQGPLPILPQCRSAFMCYRGIAAEVQQCLWRR